MQALSPHLQNRAISRGIMRFEAKERAKLQWRLNPLRPVKGIQTGPSEESRSLSLMGHAFLRPIRGCRTAVGRQWPACVVWGCGGLGFFPTRPGDVGWGSDIGPNSPCLWTALLGIEVESDTEPARSGPEPSPACMKREMAYPIALTVLPHSPNPTHEPFLWRYNGPHPESTRKGAHAAGTHSTRQRHP